MEKKYVIENEHDVKEIPNENISRLIIKKISPNSEMFKKSSIFLFTVIYFANIDGIDCSVINKNIRTMEFEHCRNIKNIPRDVRNLGFNGCPDLDPAEFDGRELRIFKLHHCNRGDIIKNVSAYDMRLLDVDIMGTPIHATFRLLLNNVRNMPIRLPQTINELYSHNTFIPNDIGMGICSLCVRNFNGLLDVPNNVKYLVLDDCHRIDFNEIYKLPNLEELYIRKIENFSWRKYIMKKIAINFKFNC